ncbi:MAG: class I SAM-dependent methyltransferase [Nanoarchaeota archaeon]
MDRSIKHSLQQRLAGICDITVSVESEVRRHTEAKRTGFVQFPLTLQRTLVLQMSQLFPADTVVIELGCGIGSFTFMNAAARFSSYGIDCNSYLIDVAREIHSTCIDQDCIDRDVDCRFAVGNIHCGETYNEYKKYAEATFAENPDRAFEEIFPLEGNMNNPYKELGISLSDADLVYCYPYPEHMPFLCKFLAEMTSSKTHFILPFYSEEYISLLPLTPIYTAPSVLCNIRLPASVSIYRHA